MGFFGVISKRVLFWGYYFILIDYDNVVYGCIGWPWLWVNFILVYFWARGKVMCLKRVYFETPWWCDKGVMKKLRKNALRVVREIKERACVPQHLDRSIWLKARLIYKKKILGAFYSRHEVYDVYLLLLVTHLLVEYNPLQWLMPDGIIVMAWLCSTVLIGHNVALFFCLYNGLCATCFFS